MQLCSVILYRIDHIFAAPNYVSACAKIDFLDLKAIFDILYIGIVPWAFLCRHVFLNVHVTARLC